ncbi:MAG: hypothetical protein ACI4RG_03195 [Huintestinicola sp.]
MYFWMLLKYTIKRFSPRKEQQNGNSTLKQHMSAYTTVSKKKIDDSTRVRFFVCKSLIDEVIVDAIIGMRKITDSQYTQTENPNSFKIIAYLTYWWLRHKPASVHYKSDFCLEDIKLKPSEVLDAMSEEERELERQKVIWQLKHINELVAVEMSLSYIFDYDKVICGNNDCKKVKRKEKENFCFESFDEMQDVIVKKLTYYFCYRTVAPKVIEHMLEGYTFHPAWGLTGSQWSGAKDEGEAP